MTTIDGINAHVPDKTCIRKAASLGISWIRIDINWNEIETRNGSYSFSAIDAAVSESKSRGLKVYATIAYTPAWLNADRRKTPPVNYWTRFVTKVAQRYDGRIDVYGMWNEPNLKSFYTGTIKEYRNVILVPGYSAVKAVNPNLVVAGGELSTMSHSNWPEWCNMLEKEMSHFDVVGIHTYQDDADAVVNRFTTGKVGILGWLVPYYRPYNMYLDKFRKKGKRIMLTEVGWKAAYASQKQQREQRKNIEALMKKKGKLNVEVIFFYELQDESDTTKNPWGLYAHDWSPKLAAL